MTIQMFKEITQWQDSVFTKATPLSSANHLYEEVKELIVAISDGDQRVNILNEYADCFLLLFGSAHMYGLSYEQILEAINNKMVINKNRKWGEVNDKGYVKHV